MAFLGQEEQIREFQDRFRYLYAILFVAMSLLLSRLIYLQILQGEQFRQYSEENRIKRVRISAPRGMIFDRERRLLVDNRPAFDLEIIPQYLKESKKTDQVVALLAKLIAFPEDQILDKLNKARTKPPSEGVLIKSDLTREEVARVKSWQINMPGVEIREEIKRTSLQGQIGSHLVGYVSKISPHEFQKLQASGQTEYKQDDVIGKFGLELKMESTLKGVDGEDLKEVDALGRTKLEKKKDRRVIEELIGREATPGKNLVLTIDQDLQMVASEAMGNNIGSVVAIDPRSGQILTMMSKPGFDATEFARGIPAKVWKELVNNPNRPLRDKTLQDHYPPGSTFKIVTAIAGLQEKVIDENTVFHCGGSMKVGNRTYHCHKKGGHGNVNVREAITKSCDVFFYKTAQRLKSVDDIAKWASHLGMGKITGVPLPREVPGLVPTEAWKMQRLKQVWNAGETLSVAIGQSYLLTTTLQLTNVYASIGNGGTVYRPFLVKSIEGFDGQVLQEFHPEVMDRLNLSAKYTEMIKQGLWGVTNAPGGTAYLSRLPFMDFVGKTGTVQVIRLSADRIYQKCENMKFLERHNAMFVGFAPMHDPVIAVGVIVEHGCHGSTTAAPVAKAVIKKYLEKFNPAEYAPDVIAMKLKKTPDLLKSAPTAKSEQSEDLVEDSLLPVPKEVTAPPAKETVPENDDDAGDDAENESRPVVLPPAEKPTGKPAAPTKENPKKP